VAIKVLIVDDDELIRFGLRAAAGADGYCLKDAEPLRLSLAIQTVYTGATWLDPQTHYGKT